MARYHQPDPFGPAATDDLWGDFEAAGATDPAPPPEPLKVIIALISAHLSPRVQNPGFKWRLFASWGFLCWTPCPSKVNSISVSSVESNQEIETEYTRLSADAIAAWDLDATPGKTIDLAYHSTALALTVGSLIPEPIVLKNLLDTLECDFEYDSRLKTARLGKLHFTFLALTSHQWTSEADIPSALRLSCEVLNDSLKDLNWVIKDL